MGRAAGRVAVFTTREDCPRARGTARRLLKQEPLMKLKTPSSRGFTLVEIMIVVAIIALLASIAVPNFMRARKRSQATRTLEDLRLLDEAIDMYAMETNKTTGNNPAFIDLKSYIKAGSTLYLTGKDIYGNSYGPFTVDSLPKVPTSTFNNLSDVAPAAFWSPYN
jgi:prepilin-type N-terminal cleavage/methylation domain-containing protein